MSKEISGIITWLKGWFFDKDDIISKEQALQTQINNKASVTDLNTTNGNVSSLQSAMDNKVDKVTGKGLSTNDYTTTEKNKLAGIEAQANKYVHPTGIGTAQTSAVFKKITYDGQGHITGTSNVGANDLPDHQHTAGFIRDTNAHSNIGTNANATQSTVNNAIDTAIGNLKSIKAIEVVSTLPTASSDTMGKLYIISEDSKINVYYTEENNGSYAWHKMDADILDELSIDWSDIENKPTSFTPKSHTHGQISTGGTLGTEANKPLITGANGLITAGQFGNQANTFCQGNDSRLSDSRNPKSHSSSATTYGVGTTGGYGHNKVINDLTHNSFTNGESLSAYQGYVLNQAIQGKQDEGDCVTSIALVPKGSDPTADAYNGIIRLYYGDEPS